MRIKKLKIQGFKSFVDKTTLNFCEGTSAIVGPNGCGKSNVVDAVRWVLGEHNARHLRGKVMEDLIFAGSSGRKPVGMAEVALTFENSEGNFPVQYANFPELEIVRRVYRSGDSEYSINKVPARLKDIVELFTDTGVGSRAYSVIEQGQIGRLITAKPEERREIFEEAAGINKFKQKKDAALRRLDSTKDNLNRVNDIISEVKRQCNSLNRQAKKAERYKVFKDELRGLDLYLAHVDTETKTARKAEIEKLVTEFNDKEIQLNASVESRGASSAELNVEYLAEEAIFKAARDKSIEVERQINSEERIIELAKVRGEEIKRTAERLKTDIEELTSYNETLTSEMTMLEATLSDIKALLGDEQTVLDSEEEKLNEVTARLREKQDQIKQLETGSLQTITRLSDIKYSIQSLLKEEESIRSRDARLRSEKTDMEKALTMKEEPVESLRVKISDALLSKQTLETELASERETLERIATEKQVTEKEIEELRSELAGKDARLNALHEIHNDAESIKVKLSQGYEEGVTGIHGTIADVITPNTGYEVAVEAVLGEKLNLVIVESHNAGMKAIDYLRIHGGRGSFVPVNGSRSPSYQMSGGGYPTDDGLKELVSEVRIKEGYEVIVNYLLGDTAVVDNIEEAYDIWNRGAAVKTFVTKNGEIIDPQGVVTGGSKEGISTVLEKRAEIVELTEEVATLKIKSETKNAEIEKINSELKNKEEVIEDYKGRLHGEDINRINLESELKALEDDLLRLGGRIDEATTLIAEMEEDSKSIIVKKAELEKEREVLTVKQGELEKSIATISEEASTIQAVREEANSKVTDHKVRLASSNEKCQSLDAQLTEKKRIIGDTSTKVESRRNEIESGKIEVEEKEKVAVEHREILNSYLEQREEVKREEVLKGEALELITKKIKAANGEVGELKSELSSLFEKKGEANLELREIEMSLENTNEKLIERYGVSIGSYTPEESIAAMDRDEVDSRAIELREKIGQMGEVSVSALEEFNELSGRHDFLLEQQEDLNKSMDSIHSAIKRINRTTRERFRKTFEEVNEKFKESFKGLFRGGKAELRLVGDGDILESGVEIIAQPPGKRLQNITLLSGGEKALTATALIFSIFLIKPSPFCILDEVDAPLDDANVDRFNSFVHKMSHISQFILITHNKRTMEMADTLFGVTMEEAGVSKAVSVSM